MFDALVTQVLTAIGFFGFVFNVFFILVVKKRSKDENGKINGPSLEIRETRVAKFGIICVDILIVYCCVNVFFHRTVFSVFLPRIDLAFMAAPVQVIGFSLLVAGDILLFSAYKELGVYWAYPLDGKTGKHKLITSGPYAFIRHPVYVSFNMIALGFLMVLLDWIVLLLYIAGAIGLYQQSLLEEEALAVYFGNAYVAYMRRTGRFFHAKPSPGK